MVARSVGIVSWLTWLWIVERKTAVLDNQVVGVLFDVDARAETEVVVLALGRCVNPSPLRATEWPFFVIAGDDVLQQLRADVFQPITDVTDDREDSQNGVPPLSDIMDSNHHQRDDRAPIEPSHVSRLISDIQKRHRDIDFSRVNHGLSAALLHTVVTVTPIETVERWVSRRVLLS